MFHFLGERLAVGPSDGSDAADRAMLESFLLRAQVLRDFFFHEGHRSEDLVAAQFVPNWKLIRPATTRYLHSQKQRLDQSLGRLTVQRLKWADSNWDIPVIRDEIGALIELFHTNLAPELRPRFEPAELNIEQAGMQARVT